MAIRHDRDPDDYSVPRLPVIPRERRAAEKLSLPEIERLCEQSLRRAKYRRNPPEPLRHNRVDDLRYWLHEWRDPITIAVFVLIIIAAVIAYSIS